MNNIKEVKFLTGIPQTVTDPCKFKEIVQYAQINGIKVSDYHNTYLGDITKRFNDRLREEKLTIKSLKELHLDIVKTLDRLNDTLGAVADFSPDASAFAIELLVKEDTGKEYTINEGLEKKIYERYETTIAALRLKKEVVATRIKYFQPTAPSDGNVINALDLIKPEFIGALHEYENNISVKVSNWKSNKDKTGCAVFCLLLFEKDYFQIKGIETVKQFAQSRYDHDFSTMITKLRKKEKRQEYDRKALEMQRLILNKPFGKIGTM